MAWRRVVASLAVALFSLNGSLSASYDVAYPAERAAHLGEHATFSDDVVILRDGTRLFGRVGATVALEFPFGMVPFQMGDVAAIRILGQRGQVVTRQGLNYIGGLVDSRLPFEEAEEVRQDFGGLAKPFREYNRRDLDLSEVNVVLFRWRQKPNTVNLGHYHSVELKSGHRFPVTFNTFEVNLNDGWRKFTIRTEDIRDITNDIGLHGLIKGEAVDWELKRGYILDKDVSVRVPGSSGDQQIPWSAVRAIEQSMGELAIETPYFFCPSAPCDMAYIPPGRFFVGHHPEGTSGPERVTAALKHPLGLKSLGTITPRSKNLAPTDGIPAELVTVQGFYIDKLEVTNDWYAQFCQETDHPTPPHWSKGKVPAGLERHPVVNVTYRDAQAFAEWAGKRLPSEVEWERAAKGATGFLFPYGSEYHPALANTDSSGTTPVGQYSDAIGRLPLTDHSHAKEVHDLSGNVAEWTSSIFLPDRYADLQPSGEANRWFKRRAGVQRVVRGGSFKSSARTATTVYRSPMAENDFNEYTGFRCVSDAQ